MTTKKVTEDIPNSSDFKNGNSSENSIAEDKKNEWKEVQLRISESGEMCITGVDDVVLVKQEDTENCNLDMEGISTATAVSNSMTPDCADRQLLKTEESLVSDTSTRIDSAKVVINIDSDAQSATLEVVARSVDAVDKIDNDKEGIKASKYFFLLHFECNQTSLMNN